MTAFSTSHLRALTMGQVIDRAIRLYRQHFFQFLGISALMQIPLVLIPLLIGIVGGGAYVLDPTIFEDVGPGLVGAGFLIGIPVFIGIIIWTVISSAAITQMASDTYFGIATSIGAAYQSVRSAWVSIIGANLWCGLGLILMVIVFVIPCVGWVLAIPGMGMLVFASSVVLPLLAPIVLLESQTARPAIWRAWQLARQRFWWLFGFFFLLSVFSALITQGPTYAIAFGLEMLGPTLLPEWIAGLLQLILPTLLGVLFTPITLICILIVYIDSRVRLEGLDLALQTISAESTPNPSAMQEGDSMTIDHASGLGQSTTQTATQTAMSRFEAILRQVPSPDIQRRPTGSEWGQFSLITVGAVVILFAVAMVMGVALAGMGGILGAL